MYERAFKLREFHLNLCMYGNVLEVSVIAYFIQTFNGF